MLVAPGTENFACLDNFRGQAVAVIVVISAFACLDEFGGNSEQR